MKIWDAIVIGGGASGMMTAAVAAKRGKSVLLLEKNNSLGEKLKISGGGRCNITNGEKNLRVLLEKYGQASKYLHTPFSLFDNNSTSKFFESRNLQLVEQERKRVFPITERAIDVYDVLMNDLRIYNVDIRNNCVVNKIVSKNGEIIFVETNLGNFEAKSFVLATGGLSHPKTGSTGDGFKFLKSLDHKVKDPTPSVVPIQTSDNWSHVLSGTTLKNAKITFFTNINFTKKKEFVKKGDILFTHFGLSGPTILNSANDVGILLQSGAVCAEMDAFPSINHGELDKKITKIFDENKNKTFKSILKEIVPEGTSKGLEILIQDLFLNQNILQTKVHSISREDRKNLTQILKMLPINIVGLMGFERAVVADGGVMLDEVDMKTFASKKYKNLFITGDMLNVNKPSGGYSLQLCWTSGYIAGMSV